MLGIHTSQSLRLDYLGLNGSCSQNLAIVMQDKKNCTRDYAATSWYRRKRERHPGSRALTIPPSPLEVKAQKNLKNHIAHLLMQDTVFRPRQGRSEGSTVKHHTWLRTGAVCNRRHHQKPCRLSRVLAQPNRRSPIVKQLRVDLNPP